jgi:uncharacterized membrane protein YdfJ with MMPL/SSD domain
MRENLTGRLGRWCARHAWWVVTGWVALAAALLMIIVFSAFAAAKMGMVEQIGLGLAVAVLIDATVVRCLLVPATMTLLGRWNWWAPAWLRRLHGRFGLREEPGPHMSRLISSQPRGGSW